MTYSILARDPETGQLGYGAQSHFFGVGRLVGWTEPGVGVVATQALVNLDFGPHGLAAMARGEQPDDIQAALVDGDRFSRYRQFAMVDAAGRTCSHTGSACVPMAGHATGDAVVAQGNMLADHAVYKEMIAAYADTAGPLAQRILAAMQAAEKAGGDARGSQSAVLKVVSGKRSETPWAQTLVDIRVDDHADPIAELARQLPLHDAFVAVGGVVFAPRLMMGEYRDVPIEELEETLAGLEAADDALGDNLEAAFWRAALLARAGRRGDAIAAFRALFLRGPHLRDYLANVGAAGIVPNANDYL
ncbi:MAG TPA: DUF1028 domain-containing protein [Pseudonocardiaceae bacterium]|jgi:uncharacterized Ntn-hydrolase superfamily protein|nr:DUF1028 domain-containing protein [Pseudonocardiaceae bacterium]